MKKEIKNYKINSYSRMFLHGFRVSKYESISSFSISAKRGHFDFWRTRLGCWVAIDAKKESTLIWHEFLSLFVAFVSTGCAKL